MMDEWEVVIGEGINNFYGIEPTLIKRSLVIQWCDQWQNGPLGYREISRWYLVKRCFYYYDGNSTS